MEKILIGSPIRKASNILNLFFSSLETLDKEGLNIDYCFVDDNDEISSKRVLQEFINRNKGKILEVNIEWESLELSKDGHFWTAEKIEKVAYFKNKIIEYFLEGDWDYLFFVDSDLIMQSCTLKNLLKDDKDIIANIFWTKWTENSREMPQVWLKDFYTLYDAHMLRPVTESEIFFEEEEFLCKLREAGVYRVGGLGACTLIKRKVLEKGVHFGSIYNLSFWGEDRSFCIRAAALGFDLYVDTRAPAFHIYKEEQIGIGKQLVEIMKEFNK